MDTALHWLAVDPVRWLAVAAVFAATLVVGIGVHELLHLIPLHLADADYTVTVLPSDAASPTAWATLRDAFTGAFVRVEVTRVPPTTPGWLVRAAALAPLALALPLALVAAGVLPDPFASGDAIAAAALVAATACGLPSPGDWAVAWHGERTSDQ